MCAFSLNFSPFSLSNKFSFETRTFYGMLLRARKFQLFECIEIQQLGFVTLLDISDYIYGHIVHLRLLLVSFQSPQMYIPTLSRWLDCMVWGYCLSGIWHGLNVSFVHYQDSSKDFVTLSFVPFVKVLITLYELVITCVVYNLYQCQCGLTQFLYSMMLKLLLIPF